VAGAQLLLKLVESFRKVDMKILCEGNGHILRFWSGNAKTWQNPLFRATFWRFLRFFEEEKGP
jgi:hypothetical protein